MLRRAFSYDDGPTPDGRPDAGLLFAAYQADAATRSSRSRPGSPSPTS
jgi:dye decolorizing peroxidase